MPFHQLETVVHAGNMQLPTTRRVIIVIIFTHHILFVVVRPRDPAHSVGDRDLPRDVNPTLSQHTLVVEIKSPTTESRLLRDIRPEEIRPHKAIVHAIR